MTTLPFQAAIQTAGNYNKAYGRCIAAVVDILKKSRLDYVLLDYGVLEPRCYDISDISGDSGASVIVKVVRDRGADTLTAYDESDSAFPLGSDGNGQDNYTLVNPDVLIRKTVEYVEAFRKKLIAPKDYTLYHMVTAIKEFLGGADGFTIDDWFMRPALEDGSRVVEITASDIRVETPTREEKWVRFADIRVRELHAVVNSVNDYLIYLHNEKTIV